MREQMLFENDNEYTHTSIQRDVWGERAGQAKLVLGSTSLWGKENLREAEQGKVGQARWGAFFIPN